MFIFLNVYGVGKIAGGQFYRRGRLPEMPFQQRTKLAIVALVVMGLLFAFDQFLVNLFGHGKG